MRRFIQIAGCAALVLMAPSVVRAQIVGGGGIQQDNERGNIRQSDTVEEDAQGSVIQGGGLETSEQGGLQGGGGGLGEGEAQGGIRVAGGLGEGAKGGITQRTNTLKEGSGIGDKGTVLDEGEGEMPIAKYAWWTLGVAALLAIVAWVVNNNISKPKMPGAAPKAPPGPTT
jgi:hypothetical protein